MSLTHEIQRFNIGTLDLESGEQIEGAFLTYSTHGRLNAQKSNAILILPSFMANHTRHDFLIGPGKAFDPDVHFIITADTLGNGWAISPSNSTNQPGAAFPRFTIIDMVRAQHRLVREAFDIDRLAAVGGLSMGGMQALQWACAFPESVAALVVIISQARMTPWVKAVWHAMRQPILAAGEDGDAQRRGLRESLYHFLLMTRHWEWYEQAFDGKPDAEQQAWMDAEAERLSRTWHPLDFTAQTRAQAAYDLRTGSAHPGDLAALLGSLSMPALLMPSATDILHPPSELQYARDRMQHVHWAEIPSLCGHMGGGGLDPQDVALMDREISRFLLRTDPGAAEATTPQTGTE